MLNSLAKLRGCSSQDQPGREQEGHQRGFGQAYSLISWMGRFGVSIEEDKLLVDAFKQKVRR